MILTDVVTNTNDSSSSFDWNTIWQAIISWASTTGIKIIIGLVLLFILIKITNKFANRVRKNMVKHDVDKTITSVVYQCISIGFKIIWLLLFLNLIGVQTASIGSIIASISVAIGLAIQGSLSNFAGGLVILVTRPFKVGDFIQAQGVEGKVEDIRMFYTHLATTDNKVVLVPNGILSSGVIVNVNAKDTRRVDEVFAIGYGSDYNKAIKVITEVVNKCELVLREKDVFVRIGEEEDSWVNVKVRVWVNTSDYWTVHFYLLETVRKALDENEIDVPYPSMDVTIKQD